MKMKQWILLGLAGFSLLGACGNHQEVSPAFDDVAQETHVEETKQKETVSEESQETEMKLETEIEEGIESVEIEEIDEPEDVYQDCGEIEISTERPNLLTDWITKKQIAEEDFLGAYSVDMDMNGQEEYFALIYGEDNCEVTLWYVSESMDENLYQNGFCADELDACHGCYYQNEGKVIFIWDAASGMTCSDGVMFTLQDGKIVECYPEGVGAPNYKYFDRNGDLVILNDFYGSLLEWDTTQQSFEDGMFSGHCYNPYRFYYDKELGKFQEYGAEWVQWSETDWLDGYPIDRSTFPKEYDRIHVIKRSNGEWDLIFMGVDEEGYSYSFLTNVYHFQDKRQAMVLVDQYDGYFDLQYHTTQEEENYLYFVKEYYEQNQATK